MATKKTTTPRKTTTTPRRRSTAAAADNPAPETALNLDTLEREDAKGPFQFVHNSRTWTLRDPWEIDWQELIAYVGNPLMLLRAAVDADDRDAFFKVPMPTWKMQALTKRYEEHYGLPSPGEDGALPA